MPYMRHDVQREFIQTSNASPNYRNEVAVEDPVDPPAQRRESESENENRDNLFRTSNANNNKEFQEFADAIE